jgi:hypothetical protein
MELAYSGLYQLCGPMLDQLERLPDPQRLTLEVVLGLTAGAAPDPFLVGLATLSLCRRRQRSVRCCASWTTHSGWIRARR